MNRTASFVILALASIVLAAGCTSDQEKQMKRDQDRMAAHLSQAEKDRDEYRAQVEKLTADLAASKKESADTQQQLKIANESLTKANNELTMARKSQADAKTTAEQLKNAQSSLTEAQKATQDAQKQVSDLKGNVTSLQAKMKDLDARDADLTKQLDEAKKLSAKPATSQPMAP